MSDPAFSEPELLLLNAALNPDPDRAVDAWRAWASASVLEEAPYPELRMLPAVHARLSSEAPELVLPQKLRGKARATFTRNQLLAHGSLPALRALSAEMPVMLIKGAAFCARFGTWSSRAMGDIDVVLPIERLSRAAEILAAAGWTPKYGMTWASMVHRAPLRRNSWNVSKGNADVDVHWRFLDELSGSGLDAELWASAQPAKFFGLDVVVPAPELAVVMALRHGFLEGSQGDRLQTALDVAAYLPLCDREQLGRHLATAGLGDACAQLQQLLAWAGQANALPSLAGTAHAAPARGHRSSIPPAGAVERRLLRRPWLYRLWELTGRRAMFERLFIRLFGPLSRPLAPPSQLRTDYDLRACRTIDEIAGPGWGWPEPEGTCFWTDRADIRLLLPLQSMTAHVVMLTTTIYRYHTPNPRLFVFANGRLVSAIDLADRGSSRMDYALVIPREVLCGPWVELSFRPVDYAGDLRSTLGYLTRRSIPAAFIRVFDAARLERELASDKLSWLGRRVMAGEEPYAAKFACIRDKMATSSFKADPRLPAQFDPVFYVLWYEDLFTAEVDPYEHFVLAGQHEGRLSH